MMTSHQTLAIRDLPTSAQGLGPRLDTRNPEHKFVTAMFADLNASTVLSRVIGPERWWSISAGLFELMCEVVYECEGWVGNFTGDGIYAVFEKSASDGHASRACEAALRLRDAIGSASETVAGAHHLELAVRIGLNSGNVVTGTLGGRYSRYYTASGYAVCLAKRMEALATPARILLTEHTAGLVAESAELRSLGTFAVKGSEVPVGVFELVGRRSGFHEATHANAVT